MGAMRGSVLPGRFTLAAMNDELLMSYYTVYGNRFNQIPVDNDAVMTT
jgi:hypothetical protein